MNPIRYFFSCILTPINALLNYGKYIRTENSQNEPVKEDEPEPPFSIFHPLRHQYYPQNNIH